MSTGAQIDIPEADRLGGTGLMTLLVTEIPVPHDNAEWVPVVGHEVIDGVPSVERIQVIVRAALIWETCCGR